MNWELVTIGVFVVVGLMEYLKDFGLEVPPMVWRIALIPAAFGIAFVIEKLPPFVLMGLLILAVAQLGYEIVVETVRKRLEGK